MKSKLKYKVIFVVLILLQCLYYDLPLASTLSSISVQNDVNQSIVTICCPTMPEYKIFSLYKPTRIVIDFLNINKLDKRVFPIEFNGNNLIKSIRISLPINCHSIRIVCDLHYESNIHTITQKKIEKGFDVILTISKKLGTAPNTDNHNVYSMIMSYQNKSDILNRKNQCLPKEIKNKNVNIKLNKKNIRTKSPIIIAIDAGHGGHDPGATGCHGIYEKHITFAIAKKLKTLLDMDPMFKAVMIRDGDYFLSVMDRSDLARKKKANVLISIHADSTINPKVKGASVWVLSNNRVKTEMTHWLQRREKHAELLGGLGDILTNYKNDPYFNHLILDLQFGFAQREGFNIAIQMLNQLKNVSFLHKNTPEYSNFGILRSPDIASVLVETGFISNLQEQYLLANREYQEKIARALYKGLTSYFTIYSEKKL